jgi:Flp pilus assembly protein TadG
MNVLMRWLNRLTFRDERQVDRQDRLPLIAHYWDGGPPLGHTVRDISRRGMYLLTEQRWYPGTLVMVSLQREDVSEEDPDRCLIVKAKVVRTGDDGVGFTFVTPDDPERISRENLQDGADKKMIDRFLRQLSSERGQALIEYILVLPLIFLLIINLVNFGGFFFAWIGVSNAARAGADYAALGGTSAGALASATGAQVTALITNDVASLRNNPSVSINVCRRNGSTAVTLAGTCTLANLTADPEPTAYVLTQVDVTYTYVPFIPATLRFPGLNIYLTIPPTTIHRRAVVRTL